MRIREASFIMCIAVLATLPSRAADTPTVTIKLSPEIHSEDATVVYYLYGAFGAVGESTMPMPNVHSYKIKMIYQGKLASSIKAVIYATGCEFDTFEANISADAVIEKSYECVPLPTVSLVGHIAHSRALLRKRNLEVVLRYLGDWECGFFELQDCRCAD
jgi:hypothetical protein